ncbi:MAG TPA: SDR family oxidoreductase [Mycobacteriales bacterium]
MRIAVAGGTGVAGSEVARILAGRGHEVRVLARSTGVDVATGRGLDAALDGVAVVVDASSVLTTRARPSVEFFTAATTRLLAAEERAGTRLHVVLSIVGIDRLGHGYYAGKLAQERLALAGPVPATVLRTTQFHEFAGQLLDRLRRGPVTVVPRAPVQPVAAREVARRLADLTVRPAAGRVPDLAGPEPQELADLVRRVARSRRVGTRVVAVRLPGRLGRDLAAGALLPEAGAETGRQTFDEWLAAGTSPVPLAPGRRR